MPPWTNVQETERACVVCGTGFLSKRPSALYCSDRCRNAARPKRAYDPVRSKEWREKRLADPAYRERINRQAKERARQIKSFLNEVKMASGCVDCGYREHPAALHFDHVVGDKEINLCFAKSIAQAKREITKCVVRCANCHAIRHYESPSTGS